jgi:hypothetical protein
MNGFEAVGIVYFFDSIFEETKLSIVAPSGNTVKRNIVKTITIGIVKTYAWIPVATNNNTEKYVVNRTTEFNASAVDIFFVGTNLFHVVGLNKRDHHAVLIGCGQVNRSTRRRVPWRKQCCSGRVNQLGT